MHSCLLLVYCAFIVVVVVKHTITTNFEPTLHKVWFDWHWGLGSGDNFHLVVRCMRALDDGRTIKSSLNRESRKPNKN